MTTTPLSTGHPTVRRPAAGYSTEPGPVHLGATHGEVRYAELAGRFRTLFERIAEGALAREADRVLPFEQVAWLKDAGFTTLRIPARHGGDPVSHEHLFRLLIESASSGHGAALARYH